MRLEQERVDWGWVEQQLAAEFRGERGLNVRKWSASKKLASPYAYCMRTLYLRNVPDDVMDRLERLAGASKMSVTAVAIRELDAATRRIDNAGLLSALPDLGIPAASIVQSVNADRR